MSERVDRRIGSTSLVAVVVVILMLAGAVGIAVWRLRAAPAASQVLGQTPPIRNPRPDEPLQVIRYMPVVGGLAGNNVPVLRQTDTQAQAREVLSALLAAGSRIPVLSDMKLRGFFLAEDGTAYVDLTTGSQEVLTASAGDEFLAVYALVNTLTQNFEEIRQVRFLIEGREAQTLAGHMDLVRAFTKRTDLVKQ